MPITTTIQETTREQVQSRVAEWRVRPNSLYEDIDAWRRELLPDSKAEWSEVIQANETPLRKARVKPGPLPAYTIIDGELRVSFTPDVLWIVGATGRVDIWVQQSSTGEERYHHIFDTCGCDGLTANWRIPMKTGNRFHVRFNKVILRRLIENRL